ncbi:MAG TPA: GNAT family N-acetyltransferase [Ilumatobacter sp.]
MPHPYWPLFDLVVRTPRIVLRYLDDAVAVELAALASKGIHDPATMPFALPWTDVESPELERNALRFYWQTRAGTAPASWNLLFAVLEGEQIVGSTSINADVFRVVRAFETGSWLGRSFQGRGLGTEMRIATLHLGFLGLDASTATTGAFDDNPASLGVTRKLGYQPNGIMLHERRGERAQSNRFLMTRQHFLDHVHRDDVEIEGDAAVREFLEIPVSDTRCSE